MLASFAAVERFRVPFRDLDFLRHVNNAAYVTWSETIRCNYLADVLGEAIEGERGWIMAGQRWEYHVPIGYRAEVAIGARIARIGGKSLEMAYEVWTTEPERLAASGSCTLVAYDYRRASTIRVPDAWRERIRAFERVQPEGL